MIIDQSSENGNYIGMISTIFVNEIVVGRTLPTGPTEIGRQKLHGWNKRRLLQWGGKFPPRNDGR